MKETGYPSKIYKNRKEFVYDTPTQSPDIYNIFIVFFSPLPPGFWPSGFVLLIDLFFSIVYHYGKGKYPLEGRLFSPHMLPSGQWTSTRLDKMGCLDKWSWNRTVILYSYLAPLAWGTEDLPYQQQWPLFQHSAFGNIQQLLLQRKMKNADNENSLSFRATNYFFLYTNLDPFSFS